MKTSLFYFCVSTYMVEDVWSLGHGIPEDFKDKYSLLGRALKNYRVLYLGDVVKHQDLNLPKFVVSFLAKEGVVLMIGNLIKDRCISITFRAVSHKAFIDYGTTKAMFYGIGDFNPDFKYGDPIIVVEGLADRDSIRDIYRNVVAVKSSSLSLLQVELLSRLTDKVILMLDNDDAGKAGTKLAVNRLSKKKISTLVIDHPGVKDAGTMYDFLAMGNYPRYEDLHDLYTTKIRSALCAIKV